MDSSLNLTLYDLEAEVGDYAGFGLGARFGDGDWTDQQTNRITRAVQSGVRNVYWTQEMQDIPANYDWSWLKPVGTLVLASGESSLDLPDDFNGLTTNVLPVSDSGEMHWPVAVVGYGEVYGARMASPDTTGRPLYCYDETLRPQPGRGTRHRLQVYPIADQAYTFRVPYTIAPDALTDRLPHLYGGPALAETFKAAVRAAYAETFEPGTQEAAALDAKFREKLRAAIAGDRKHKPLTIGPNLDRSDWPTEPFPQHGRWGVPLYINGVLYP